MYYPGIFIAVIAAPCKEESKTLLRAFPKVKPNPNGSTTILATLVLSSVPESTQIIFDGLISEFQFYLVIAYSYPFL